MLNRLLLFSAASVVCTCAYDLYNSPSFETEEVFGQRQRLLPNGNRIRPAPANTGYGQLNGYGYGQGQAGRIVRGNGGYGGYPYGNAGDYGGYWPHGYGNGYGQQQGRGGQFPGGNGAQGGARRWQGNGIPPSFPGSVVEIHGVEHTSVQMKFQWRRRGELWRKTFCPGVCVYL